MAPLHHTQDSLFFDGSPFVQISDLYCGLSDARHGSTEKRQARAPPLFVDLPMLDSLGGKGALASLDSLLGTCAGMNEVVKSIKCLVLVLGQNAHTHACASPGLHHGCFFERSS